MCFSGRGFVVPLCSRCREKVHSVGPRCRNATARVRGYLSPFEADGTRSCDGGMPTQRRCASAEISYLYLGLRSTRAVFETRLSSTRDCLRDPLKADRFSLLKGAPIDPPAATSSGSKITHTRPGTGWLGVGLRLPTHHKPYSKARLLTTIRLAAYEQNSNLHCAAFGGRRGPPHTLHPIAPDVSSTGRARGDGLLARLASTRRITRRTRRLSQSVAALALIEAPPRRGPTCPCCC